MVNSASPQQARRGPVVPPAGCGDLLRMVAERISHPAIKRAAQSGTAEVLGRFRKLEPGNLPGWIVRVTSQHGREWTLSLSFDTATFDFVVRSVIHVPWTHWCGNPTGQPSLDNGYDPIACAQGADNSPLRFDRDELILYADAAKYLTATGFPTTRQTIYNWEKKGANNVDRVRMFLRTERRDGIRYTTIDWIDTFFASTERYTNRRGRPRLYDRPDDEPGHCITGN